MSVITSIADRWAAIFDRAAELGVAGGIAAVAVGDEQTALARGHVLHVTDRYEPYNEELRRNYAEYRKSAEAVHLDTYESVAPGQFVAFGTDPGSLAGFFGRMTLLAALPAASGRRPGLHQGLRYVPKVASLSA